MKTLILLHIALLSAFLSSASASEPRVVVAADSNHWISPQYSPNDKVIAFTDSSMVHVWIVQATGLDRRIVVQTAGVGTRFVFEPGSDRMAYRFTIHPAMDPIGQQRIMSTSLYQYDPVMRTSNTGKIYGPYYVDNRVLYRLSLTEPLLDYSRKTRLEAPYLDTASGKLWVRNAKGDTVYTSPDSAHIISMEIAPNGKAVAFVLDNPRPAITYINMDNGKSVRVGDGFWPGWSGDSQHLVYVAVGASDIHEIRIFDVASETSATIFSSPNYDPQTPALNSNGTRILFSNKGAICEITRGQ